MTGVLLIDKPAGPTSHDVVARLRRTSGERKMGHTGTLDPLATGLLPLVLGRATKLASWLTTSEKTYDATIHLGITTDTDDAEGQVVGGDPGAVPADEAVVNAVASFNGEFEQVPPRHSAKRLGGRRAYDLARRGESVDVKAVPVRVSRIEVTRREGPHVHVRVTAAAGFYVRSLARDLGAALGCGAHLAHLRRTASGGFDIHDAVPLDAAERLGTDVVRHLVPAARVLPNLRAVSVTEAGLGRVTHGNAIGVPFLVEGAMPTGTEAVKLLAPDGRLVAIAHIRGGALHPVVVLG